MFRPNKRVRKALAWMLAEIAEHHADRVDELQPGDQEDEIADMRAVIQFAKRSGVDLKWIREALKHEKREYGL